MKRRADRPVAALQRLLQALDATPMDRAKTTERAVQLGDALAPLIRQSPDDPLLTVLANASQAAGLWAFFGEPRDRDDLEVQLRAAKMLGVLELTSED